MTTTAIDRPRNDELPAARLTAAEISAPELNLVQTIGDQKQTTTYRDIRLTDIRDGKIGHGESAKGSIAATGTTIEEAVRALDWHDGELVLVGSSRLAAPRHLFLGSTAAKMLRELPVPMIVVPSTTS